MFYRRRKRSRSPGGRAGRILFINMNPDLGAMGTDMAEDIVVKILRNELKLEDDVALSDATRLQEIPNLDSLGLVRIFVEIELFLGDQLSMDELIGIESVGDIRHLLAAKGKPAVEG